jgi:hypothetical protein
MATNVGTTWARRLLRGCICVLLTLASVTVLVGHDAATAEPAGASPAIEDEFFTLLNQLRIQHGKPGLVDNTRMASWARDWSNQMATSNKLAHDPDLVGDLKLSLLPGQTWYRAAENVGVGYTARSLHDAFVASPGHFANMVGDHNSVGIGVVERNGKIWVTVRFAKLSPLAAPGDGRDGLVITRGDEWHIRHTATTGPADVTFRWGDPAGTPVMGDWDGNGVDTIGYRTGNQFVLRNRNTVGGADIILSFGRPDDEILIGDWNGDGRDTLAVRRGREYHIRNDLVSGPAQQVVTYGVDSDVAYVGDWNGDGRDTLAVRRGNTYYMRNDLLSGVAQMVLAYGWASDEVTIGDWNGDRRDSLAVKRGSDVHLRNSLTSGPAESIAAYGRPSDVVVGADA